MEWKMWKVLCGLPIKNRFEPACETIMGFWSGRRLMELTLFLFISNWHDYF
jgi:hypothetical protein